MKEPNRVIVLLPRAAAPGKTSPLRRGLFEALFANHKIDDGERRGGAIRRPVRRRGRLREGREGGRRRASPAAPGPAPAAPLPGRSCFAPRPRRDRRGAGAAGEPRGGGSAGPEAKEPPQRGKFHGVWGRESVGKEFRGCPELSTDGRKLRDWGK